MHPACTHELLPRRQVATCQSPLRQRRLSSWRDCRRGSPRWRQSRSMLAAAQTHSVLVAARCRPSHPPVGHRCDIKRQARCRSPCNTVYVSNPVVFTSGWIEEMPPHLVVLPAQLLWRLVLILLHRADGVEVHRLLLASRGCTALILVDSLVVRHGAGAHGCSPKGAGAKPCNFVRSVISHKHSAG
jgi:hypothetical protein